MMNNVDIKPILDRLILARKNAGLTDIQAGKLAGNDLDLFLRGTEAGFFRLRVDDLLRLCEIYDVDVTWVLTGHNPNFDPIPIMEAAAKSNVDPAERDDIIDLLESMQQDAP